MTLKYKYLDFERSMQILIEKSGESESLLKLELLKYSSEFEDLLSNKALVYLVANEYKCELDEDFKLKVEELRNLGNKTLWAKTLVLHKK